MLFLGNHLFKLKTKNKRPTLCYFRKLTLNNSLIFLLLDFPILQLLGTKGQHRNPANVNLYTHVIFFFWSLGVSLYYTEKTNISEGENKFFLRNINFNV